MDMTMSNFVKRSFAVGALLLTFALPAAAQQDREQETEFASWRLPGWSFTPGLAIGVTRDSNVALAALGDTAKPQADSLFGIEPYGSLEFFDSRTTFSAGYRGYVRRYVEIDELNGFDQTGYLQFRHMATKRISVFARNDYLNVPTTDEVMLNGLPFQRTGTRTNTAATGLQARLTKFTNLTARYELYWIDFDNEGTELTGGWVNGVYLNVNRHLTERATIGAEYSVRLADLNHGLREMSFNDAGAVVTYAIGAHTTVSAAAGISHLSDQLLRQTRTAPYFRGGIVRTLQTSTIGASYERTFVPSFGIGGSNESQELRGYVHMPIPKNRAYVDGSAAWRHAIPYLAKDLELDSFVTHATVGYAITRWFRVEGYHAYTRQDSKVTGGEIDRHRIGAQLVISQPMRIE
jgi:hypothetical protein